MDTLGLCFGCLKRSIVKKHDSDETKNYIYLEDCISNDWCIDCVLSCLQYVDLSFEAMKRQQFSVWFMAIKNCRYDVLEKLIEYGCERYSEYKHFLRYGSYTVLMTSFGYYRDDSVKRMLLKNFLDLFLVSGIDPTVEAKDICSELNALIRFDRRWIFDTVLDVMANYGFIEKEIEYIDYDGYLKTEKRIVFERDI